MQIKISARDGVPIYLQIIQQVKLLVASGRLKPGDELPAIRTLAEQLLINPNTVARAYRELELAGVVEKRRTAGTYVADQSSPMVRRERMRILTDRIDQLLVDAEHMDVGLEEVIKLLHQRSNILSQSSKKQETNHD